MREAARECRDWADALVVCGFAFDPLVGETTMNLGRLVVLKARMSQELHAADAYKAGGGNLFVVFGEPDIAFDRDAEGNCVARLKGVDIFDPTTGEVRSSGRVEDDVACKAAQPNVKKIKCRSINQFLLENEPYLWLEDRIPLNRGVRHWLASSQPSFPGAHSIGP